MKANMFGVKMFLRKSSCESPQQKKPCLHYLKNAAKQHGSSLCWSEARTDWHAPPLLHTELDTT